MDKIIAHLTDYTLIIDDKVTTSIDCQKNFVPVAKIRKLLNVLFYRAGKILVYDRETLIDGLDYKLTKFWISHINKTLKIRLSYIHTNPQAEDMHITFESLDIYKVEIKTSLTESHSLSVFFSYNDSGLEIKFYDV